MYADHICHLSLNSTKLLDFYGKDKKKICMLFWVFTAVKGMAKTVQ